MLARRRLSLSGAEAAGTFRRDAASARNSNSGRRRMNAANIHSTAATPESTVLDGRVAKWSLPALELPLGPDAPALKRLRLPQGELAQFYDADEGIRYLAFIELLPGQVRGNHYHRVKEELLYVIRGEVVLCVADIESKARADVTLRAGDLAVIRTRIAHALRTVEAGQAIEFSPARFDAADIHPFLLSGGVARC